ncbi:MAG: hypothetical protein ACREF3_12140, partial [Acetobacteraceae bacterium]
NAPMSAGPAKTTTTARMHAQNAPQYMNTRSRSTAMSHRPLEEHHRVATRPTHISSVNPNAQNAAIERLNGQSLQAARQGKTFMPSSNL